MSLWECCPCGLHSVISRLLAEGLGFRIVHHLLLPGSQIVVWHFVVCCFAFVCIAIPIPEVIQMYSCIFQLPMNWSADYRPCWFLFLFWLCCLLFRVLVCFVCFCVFGVCFLLHGDSSNGLCFVSHCHYDQCCYCINSVNLHNAIIFPAWWTTWREHLALDGKKVSSADMNLHNAIIFPAWWTTWREHLALDGKKVSSAE